MKEIIQFVLVSRDIDAILNVLSRWLEEFRSVDVIPEESSATDASTARSIEASVPQKPQLLMAFIVQLQKTVNNQK